MLNQLTNYIKRLNSMLEFLALTKKYTDDLYIEDDTLETLWASVFD